MIFNHSRWQIWASNQHPYKHALGDFFYSNPAFGAGVVNASQALDYVSAALYPQALPAVATVAALPAVGNNIGDYRVVNDDGDGKAASYKWLQYEGEAAPSWHKIADLDWGADSILQAWEQRTQDNWVMRKGYDEIDASGAAVVGLYSGQNIFGGRSAGTNLTLWAGAGDGAGARTGFIQVARHFRPDLDASWDLGDTTHQFRTGYLSTSLIVGTLTVAPASITDSGGSVAFTNTTPLLKNGTAGAPSLAYISDTTTGLFRAGAGITAFASAGVEAGRFAAAGLQVPDGTAAAPSVAFTSSATVGLYRYAANSLGFSANGADVGHYTTAGLWAFGSVVPSARIHALATGIAGIRVDTDLAAIPFDVQNGSGTHWLYMDTSANTWFHGGVYVDQGGAHTGPGVVAFGFVTDYTTGLFQPSHGILCFAANASERMRINSTGEIGIGKTATLGIALDVSGSLAAANFLLSANAITNTSVNGGIALTPNGVGRVSVGVALDPITDNAAPLGASGKRWTDLFMTGTIGDGTTTIASSVIQSLRGINVGVSSGMSLFWTGSQWQPSLPDTEIVHNTLSGLTTGDAGHTQFALLAGRAGGQTLAGGTAASENLALQSTAHATKGFITSDSVLKPTADGTLDFGATGANWKDLYLTGQMYGARLQNATTGAAPTPGAGTKGQLYFATDTNEVYVDTGGTWKKVATDNYYNEDAANWGAATTTVTYLTSASIPDARKAIWQFKDNANNYKVMIGADISSADASHVTVTFGVAPGAGTYTLVGIG